MWSSKSQITNEPFVSRTCCTLCNGEELPKGRNHNICPRAECQTCKLFGHVAKDCVYANSLDVDIDWLNLLFTKSESTVQAYFAEASVQAVSLRTDGIVRPIDSWPISISRVVEDDTIVKETIVSTGGYRNNLLRVGQVVLGPLHFNRDGKWVKKILRGRTRDRPPLHPARFGAADLRGRFYFVDEHSNFDSN